MADAEPENCPTPSVEPSEHHKEVATAEIQEPAHSLAGKEARLMATSPAETLTSNMPPEPTPPSGQGDAYCEDTVEATHENDLQSALTDIAQDQVPGSPHSEVDEVTEFLNSLSDAVEPSQEDHVPSPKAGASQAEVPRLTPDHRLTAEELRSLRKPGDTVTTASGHKVEVLEDGEGRLLFLSQPSVSTTSNEPNEDPSTPVPRSPPKKGKKRGSILASIDLKNIIDFTEEEGEHATVDTPPTSSIPPSTYSLRNRRATQGKLVYDVKYHPMDDSIRPTQAAKRRSAHGEPQVISDDEGDASDTYSVHAESEDDEDERDAEVEEKPKTIKKGKKRARCRSTTPEPTRRSSRQTTKPKVSYNMKVHPQDRDLEVSSDIDCNTDAPSGRRKRQKISRSIEKDPSSPARKRGASDAIVISSEITDEEDEQSQCNHAGSVELSNETVSCEEQENEIRTSSPLSVVTTPPRYGIRQKEGLDVWFLKPGQRYFRHDKDSWPGERGRDFDIHTDRLEDQLAIEANALSPLNYDHEDKENDVTNFRSEETVSPTDSMTVMPATQYRSLFGGGNAQNHHPAVMDAFYATERMFTTYDLGGSDGANDAADRGPKLTLGAMDILASSDNLPRATNV